MVVTNLKQSGEVMCYNVLVYDVFSSTNYSLSNKAALVFLLSSDCGCFHCFENEIKVPCFCSVIWCK